MGRGIGIVIAAGLVACAVTGCQSGGGHSRAAAHRTATTSPAPWEGVPTPAPVTDAPSISPTPVQLLSKKWGPKLDALTDGTTSCRDLHSQTCARAVAASGALAGKVYSDMAITETTGRYVLARPQAFRVMSAASTYAAHCTSKNSSSYDQECQQSVLDATSGPLILKAQLKADERKAGLL